MCFSLELKSCEVSASPLIPHSFSVNSPDFNYYLLMNSKATPLVLPIWVARRNLQFRLNSPFSFLNLLPPPSSLSVSGNTSTVIHARNPEVMFGSSLTSHHPGSCQTLTF